MAQSIGHPTLHFRSSHDLMVHESLVLGSALTVQSLLGIVSLLSLCPSPAHAFSLKTNFQKTKILKKNKSVEKKSHLKKAKKQNKQNKTNKKHKKKQKQGNLTPCWELPYHLFSWFLQLTSPCILVCHSFPLSSFK